MASDNDFFRFMQLPKELVTDNRPLRLRDADTGKHFGRPELIRIAEELQTLVAQLAERVERHTGEQAQSTDLADIGSRIPLGRKDLDHTVHQFSIGR